MSQFDDQSHRHDDPSQQWRSILAISLSALVLVLWQWYVAPQTSTSTSAPAPTEATKPGIINQVNSPSVSVKGSVLEAPKNESLNQDWTAQLSDERTLVSFNQNYLFQSWFKIHIGADELLDQNIGLISAANADQYKLWRQWLEDVSKVKLLEGREKILLPKFPFSSEQDLQKEIPKQSFNWISNAQSLTSLSTGGAPFGVRFYLKDLKTKELTPVNVLVEQQAASTATASGLIKISDPLKRVVLNLTLAPLDTKQGIDESSVSTDSFKSGDHVTDRPLHERVVAVHTTGLNAPEHQHLRLVADFSLPNTSAHHSEAKFIYLTQSLDHLSLSSGDPVDGLMKWFGVDYDYHFWGAVFTGEKVPASAQFIDAPESPMGQRTVRVTLLPTAPQDFQFSFLFSKKNYNLLKQLGHQLDLSVDFGFFSFLAIPTLWLLKFFNNFFHNFGWAIVALTVLVRLITYPLQHTSLKSMKKMQAIQPELQKIKEQFKDDPARLQKETMELFKRSKVNPLGGCFPLLLQMPFFFALYSVLSNSVELVHSPFLSGWITDLSMKDPWYVLPVTMSLLMVIQQKITPNTITDKIQLRMMMIMPIFFGFIMKDLPSGLNLYMLVSTLFGLVQQLVTVRLSGKVESNGSSPIQLVKGKK